MSKDIPTEIAYMNSPQLRVYIQNMEESTAQFVSNYNHNVEVMNKMEETIITLDAENERLQMQKESLIATITILAEDI